MSGTVNISRSIWHDTAFSEQPLTEREAWIWLVMEASWKGREKRVGNVVVTLGRGQLAASVRFMADAWKWHRSSVDRYLKRLKKRDMIETASETGVNVITICKYNEYQNTPKDSETPKKRKARQQRDSSETNENKGLIPEEIKPPKSPKGECPFFSEFWAAYPACKRKTDKPKARVLFAKIIAGKHPQIEADEPEKIIAGIKAYAATNPDQEFIPLPTTWLNGERWTVSHLPTAKKYGKYV